MERSSQIFYGLLALFGLFLLLFTSARVFVRLFLSLARPSPPAA